MIGVVFAVSAVALWAIRLRTKVAEGIPLPTPPADKNVAVQLDFIGGQRKGGEGGIRERERRVGAGGLSEGLREGREKRGENWRWVRCFLFLKEMAISGQQTQRRRPA